MSLSLALFTFLLSATRLSALEAAIYAPQPHFSPEIIKELKDFLHLIPPAVVDELVAKHYVVDGHFRKAANFLRSAQCKQLLERVQHVPEIVEILEFVHLESNASRRSLSRTTENPLTNHNAAAVVAASAAESLECAVDDTQVAEWQRKLADVIANVPLEIELLPHSGGKEEASASLHSFTSFVEELAHRLPRAEYVEMINEKRRRSAAFAAFYAALRSAQFAVLLESALKSPNLAEALQTLSNNDIDVGSLKPICFTVLSWGPRVPRVPSVAGAELH